MWFASAVILNDAGPVLKVMLDTGFIIFCRFSLLIVWTNHETRRARSARMISSHAWPAGGSHN
jgi:hypothetical protein